MIAGMSESDGSGGQLVIPFYNLQLGDLIESRAALVTTCGACRQTKNMDVIPVAFAKGPTFEGATSPG